MVRLAIASPLVVIATVMLSGCSVMQKLGFGRTYRPVETRVADSNKYGGAIALGRQHLDEGNFGLAIDAFQRALGAGEAQAPALNGLGVAYAKLGRTEVAARLFRLAMTEDPGNASYGANLALLERSHPVMAASTPPAALASAALPSAVAPANSEPASVAPNNGRLVRVAPREFAIRTLYPAPSAGHGDAVAGGFRPIIRISLRNLGSAPTGSSR